MATPAQTLYEVLEVAPAATADEIRASYHRLAARYHPDRHQGNPLADLAAAKLVALNRAYEVLSDPARRAIYDAELAAQGPARRAPGVAREARTLGVLVRAASVVFAILMVARVVPVVWRLVVAAFRAVAEGVGALDGTPAIILIVVVGVGGAIAFARRRRQR